MNNHEAEALAVLAGFEASLCTETSVNFEAPIPAMMREGAKMFANSGSKP